MDPLEGTLYGRLSTDLTSELTHFNPGVKGNNQPYFRFHPVDRRVEQLAAVPGFDFFSEFVAERRETSFFSSFARETDRCHRFNTARHQDMLSGVVLFLLVILVRLTSCAPNS